MDKGGEESKEFFKRRIILRVTAAVVAFVLAVPLAYLAIRVAMRRSIGIIGGSDGPTHIFLSDDTEKLTRELYYSKTKHVGDNVAVGKIINLLPFGEGLSLKNFELQTEKEPFGITLNYVISDYQRAVVNDTVRSGGLYKNAALLLCLVDNADNVTINIEDENKGAAYKYTYFRDDFDKAFEKPLREYALSLEGFMPFFTALSEQKYITDIDHAVADAILTSNSGSYLSGECIAEGHIILGTEETTGNNGTKSVTAYVLATYGEYGFQNGNFVKVSGTGVIPNKITFEVDSAGRHTLKEYKYPRDGSEYMPSIKEMFLRKYWDRIFSSREDDYAECKAQEIAYAEVYLNSIGRPAEVGDYGDFEHVLPGMNVEASNALFNAFYEYPYWAGTQEKIENGVRYVYEKQWEDKGGGDGIVTYKKYEFDTGKTVEETVIEIKNGEMIYLKGEPRDPAKKP